MNSKLIVKNFGPILNANLDLKSVNVIIGSQASGKSTLAKLYTICKSPSMFHLYDKSTNFFIFSSEEITSMTKEISLKKFNDSLESFSIFDFLTKKTEIFFDSPTHTFEFKNSIIRYTEKIDFNFIYNCYNTNELLNFEKEVSRLRKLSDIFNTNFLFDIFYYKYTRVKEKEISDFNEFYKENKTKEIKIENKETGYWVLDTIKDFENDIFFNKALYIPAERSILNLIKQSSFAFQKGKVPLPNHLLDFALVYQNSTDKVRKYDLSFLKENTFYKNINGDDRIYFSQRKSIKLSESASGFQSVLPILLPISFEKNNNYTREHFSFVIEEPETNLFPKAQYDLLKFLEKDRSDDFGKIDKGITHTYTTHSPFVLSSLNNLLFAYQKGNINKEIEKSISKIIPINSWINPKEFSAYQIINGVTKSIFNKKSGLIEENVINGVSEDIMEDFRNIAIVSVNV